MEQIRQRHYVRVKFMYSGVENAYIYRVNERLADKIKKIGFSRGFIVGVVFDSQDKLSFVKIFSIHTEDEYPYEFPFEELKSLQDICLNLSLRLKRG